MISVKLLEFVKKFTGMAIALGAVQERQNYS
jgi:hypothetical protein